MSEKYGKTVAEFFEIFKNQTWHKWISKEKYQREIEKPKMPGQYPDFTEEATEDDATLMLSKCKSGGHIVLLDLDVEAYLIPSSTPGHSHLIINEEITWWEYDAIMAAMVDAGLVESGYHKASRKRGFAAIRLPWVKKGDEPWADQESKDW